MSNELTGRRVAFMVANEGMEQAEFTGPWQAVRDAGGSPELLAPEPGQAQAFNHLDKGDAFPVDRTVGEADAADYDALVLPGGVANPDRLRMVPAAVEFARPCSRPASRPPSSATGRGRWSRRISCAGGP
jgi:protease I